MAGPLVSGIRKMMGYDPSRSIIDPMREMTARDRQRGGDISNPYPSMRAGYTSPTAAPGEELEPELPEDTDKPYEGMNFFQAMVTPMSTAAAGRKERLAMAPPTQATPAAFPAGRQRPGAMPPPEEIPAPAPAQTDLAKQVEAIYLDPKLTDAIRYQRMADAAFSAALSAQQRGDQKAAAGYLKAYELASARHQDFSALDRVAKSEDDTQKARMAELERQLQGQTDLVTKQGEVTQAVNAHLATLDQQAASLASGMADDEKPLRENPALTVGEYAKRQRAMAEEAARQKGQQMLPDQAQAIEDNAHRMGFRVRVGQYVKEMLENPQAQAFDGSHPGMAEIKNYYQAMLKKNPSSYDAIARELGSTLTSPVYSAAMEWSKKHSTPVSHADIGAYTQQLIDDILGQRPPTMWESMWNGY